MATIQHQLWPDDIPFNEPIPNFEAGLTSTILQVRLFIDRGDPGAGAVVKDTHLSVSLQDPTDPANRLVKGAAPMDGLWTQVRFVDASPNIEPYVTGWTRLGAYTLLSFPAMVSDSWRTYEVRFTPPSFASASSWTFYTNIHSNETSFAIPGAFVDADRGVITGWNDARQSKLVSGVEVTASVVPDDLVHIAEGAGVFQGLHVGMHLIDPQFDDLDTNLEALDVGESYYAMLSRTPDGLIDVVKGLRNSVAVKPLKAIDKVFNAYVKVAFTGGPPEIAEADIENSTDYGHFHATAPDTGLTFRVHSGYYQSSGTFRVASGFADLALVASDFNYIWLQFDGTFLVTQSATHPEFSSDLLYIVETGGANVIDVVDVRKFYGNPTVLELGGVAVAAPEVLSQRYIPELLQVTKVVAFCKSNGSTGTDTILDILVNGVSIYPNPGTIDTRITIPVGAVDFNESTNLHVVSVIPRGATVELSAVQYPDQNPDGISVMLFCR